MKYADLLLPAPPLETVKQIRESGTADAARVDVETFVISDRMAGQLADVIFPNLRFDRPGDQKGILTVATYGTGKTHLMSVVAGVAEFGELADALRHDGAKDAAQPIAGKFKAIRFDIGSTTLSLRDIVCTELGRGLAAIGVEHEFPDWSSVTGTKDALVDMMSSFEAVYPDHGLLFVLDEMLEYLRGRRDGELIQDLTFLREIGEICRSTRFRFISGVQEAIFDNPRFQGVADTIRRVRDRFEQVRIAKEDVAFVVEQRLLLKDATRRAAIEEHLRPFTVLYDGMAERMDRFVSLFPVHPDYLQTFSDIQIVEKREVLRTIEREVRSLADTELPTDHPGLICADSYRARLADDPSARTIPEVQEVLDKSETLRSKAAAALPDRQYVDTALRIIDALAVHRLTTLDVRTPVGMTAEMLRDQLCLLPPGLPERDALFLKTTIDSIVRKVITAVSGLFLSVNPDNGQIYLDLDKETDYDQLIEQRAASLDRHELDAAYYLAMQEVLGQSDAPYVGGYRIWQYALPWDDTNADRRGYLFMGAPNERSTAQPPRDFYVYFLQPYDPPEYTDEERPDEVFVRLAAPDAEFESSLRRYAGATAKAKESTAGHRAIYEDRARRALQEMVTWLRSHMATAMTITHQGTTEPLGTWLGRVAGDRSEVREQINAVAAAALAPHFGARYPGYPRFTKRITPTTFESDVRVALTQIASGRPTAAGTSILEALELNALGGGLRPDGRFASEIIRVLTDAGGLVVNRSDLLTERDPGVLVWGGWHLEPAWLMVVAAALTQQGKAELGVAGSRIGALNLDNLTRLSVDELQAFDHIAPPTTLPVTQLRSVAELLGVNPAGVRDSGATEALVRELLTAAAGLLARVDAGRAAVGDGVELWGERIFDLIDERLGRLDDLRQFLLDLRVRNTVGKMNNLDVTAALAGAQAGKAELELVEDLLAVRERLTGIAEHLREAHGVFGAGVPESAEALTLRSDILEMLDASPPVDAARVAELRAAGDDLRRRFSELASRAYRHDHLDAAGDRRKQQLLEGPQMSSLNALSPITILQAEPLERIRSELADLRVLIEIDEVALSRSVVLPGRVPPRPIDGPSAAARLEQAERDVTELVTGWEATLRDSLGELRDQMGFLDDAIRSAIGAFAEGGPMPQPVTPALVAALEQVFRGVDVRYLADDDVRDALFPDTSPATAAQLRERLDDLIARSGGTNDSVRFLPGREVTT